MSPPDSSDSEGDTNRSKSERLEEDEGGETAAVHSLGEALAGVTIGKSSSGGFSSSSSASFARAPGLTDNSNGWGKFTDSTQAAFAAESQINPPSGLETGTQVRNDGLDLFFSQGPSKSLGEDVFKLSHPNLPELGREATEAAKNEAPPTFRYGSHPTSLTPGRSSSFGEMRPIQENRRRTESPSCSVTGTTTSSRSVSPYTNSSGDVGGNSGRTIQAYQRYDATNVNPELLGRNQASFADDDRSSSGGYSLTHGHGSHPSLATLDSAHRSPYAKDRSHTGLKTGSGSPYDNTSVDRPFGQNDIVSPANLQQAQSSGSAGNPQPQVLYMAVPSPDGRGQVLQPVQMLQLPGKPYHFVSSTGNVHQQVDTSSPMMVLPPISGQNGSEGFQSPLSVGAENRSRIANYAMDNSAAGRQYSLDVSPSPGTRDDLRNTGSPFQVDSSVASLYSAQQRPPLEALLGQVRRLSRDQVGCRLVQQALDEEGPMAATLILNEGLPFWGEAMVDPFGNYLFQKILEKVTPEERIMLVKSVSPRLVNASLNLHGTRSVQKVVELCSQDEQNKPEDSEEETAADVLTSSLTPAAARLCIDSHGNHVIQRILLKLGPKHTKFVFDAVAASVGDVARHRHGCCVIQRCLDSPPSESRANLVSRIVDKSLELMQDAYGNYVVQYVLDVCSDEDVHAVCESVVGKVNLLAIQKFSSNVMEKCLERCSDRVREQYLQEMSDPERIRELMMDPFGNYVVQRALSVATHAQAVRLVEAMRPHLLATQTNGPHGQRNGGVRNTAGGRRIIAKICRRFPNFTLSAIGSQEEIYSSNKSNPRHHTHHHQAPPVMTSYAPVGAPTHAHGQHYVQDPRLVQGHLQVQQQQQQSFYNVVGNPYFEPHHFSSGNTGYPGM